MFNRAVFVWFLLAAIWGSTWLVIKLGLDAQLPPFTLMWSRFAMATLVLSLIALTRRRHLPRKRADWLMIFLTGNMMFSINYTLVYWAETHISSALAAMIYTTLPLIGGVGAHFLLADEPLARKKVIGALLGLGGVALIFAEQLGRSAGTGWGVAAMLVAVTSTAISSLLIKRYLRHMDPVVLTSSHLWCSFPPMLVLGLVVEGSPFNMQWSSGSLLGIAYLGIVGTSLTFALLNWLYHQMEVTKTQLIPLASTLIAVFLGWVVRGETHGLKTLIGGIIILVGLLLAASNRRTVAPASCIEDAV